MKQNKHLLVDIKNSVCSLTLNRPEIHNAFDDVLIEDLIEALNRIADDSDIRVVLLKSTGKSFSAGADLNWMRRMAQFSEAENKADARRLAELMLELNALNKPTIALVQGATFGGAVGLIACCDVVLSTTHAKFCFSEVKIGLTPAVISPYVIAAIGEKQARRYFLTAEVIHAETALALGLVHEVVEDLEKHAEYIIQHILHNAPKAVFAAKKLIEMNMNSPTNSELIENTADSIATARISNEGQEGLSAFLEKRKANWVPDDL